MKNRIEKLQTNLNEAQATLLFEGANRRYFTNFNSSAGVVIITAKKAVFMVDFRYIENAKKHVKSMDVMLFTDQVQQIAEFLKEEKIKEVFLKIDNKKVSTLKVNMGKIIWDFDKIPVFRTIRNDANVVVIEGVKIYPVLIGNPHAVCFVDNLKEFDATLKAYKDSYIFELDGKEINLQKELVAHILPYIEF